MNLHSTIDLKKLPKHVAIIMDGNGRWARSRGKPRLFGHRNGVKNVRGVVNAAREFEYHSLPCMLLVLKTKIALTKKNLV